jgi:hypothetical protein
VHVHTAGTDHEGCVVHYLVWLLRSNPRSFEESYGEAVKQMKLDDANVAAFLHSEAARLAAVSTFDE